MKSRFFLIGIALTAGLLLAGLGLVLLEPARVEAQGPDGCAQEYVVQYGDTLYSISRRFGTDVDTLIALNNIRNPNLIYAWTTLCVAAAEPAPPPQVVIEVTYSFARTAEEKLWPMAKAELLGKQVAYPLAGIEALQTVTTSNDLLAAVSDADLPLLWLTRLRSNATGYALVSVGAGEPLAALRISDTEVTEPFVPSPTPLDCPTKSITVVGDIGLTAKDMTLFLEAADGVRYPFPITGIAHADDVSDLSSCFCRSDSTDFGMALLKPSPGQEGYRAVVVLTQEGIGPPSPAPGAACEQWKAGGWYYYFLRALYGCP